MKIENIKVINFKSFKEFNFDFKKINVILGPNNSGKSNILKLLLLLKQTFTSSLESPLILNGNIFNLGSFKNITYRFNTEDINIKYKILYPHELIHEKRKLKRLTLVEEGPNRLDFEFQYNFDVLLNKIYLSKIQIRDSTKSINILDFQKDIKLTINNQPAENYVNNFKKILGNIIKNLESIPKFEFISKKGFYKSLSNTAKNLKIHLDFPDISPLFNFFINILQKLKNEDLKISINFENKFPVLDFNIDLYFTIFEEFKEFVYRLNSKAFTRNLSRYIKSNNIEKITKFFKDLYDFYNNLRDVDNFLLEFYMKLDDYQTDFLNYFENLYYIGPLRKVPQRYYSVIGESAKDVGFKGEFTPHVLKKLLEKTYSKDFIEKIKYWLNQFEMAKETDIKSYEEITELISIICKEYFSGVKVNISDMGFGTSQVLPIIIEGYIIEENSVLIIEQPEIHLHPKAQAILGDLFINIAKENKILIIETHSEHLIQRIQRRIAENEISNNDVIFYYVTMGKEGSILKKLEIDEDGYIKEIPEGFFDEDFKEAYEHIKTIIKKKEKER